MQGDSARLLGFIDKFVSMSDGSACGDESVKAPHQNAKVQIMIANAQQKKDRKEKKFTCDRDTAQELLQALNRVGLLAALLLCRIIERQSCLQQYFWRVFLYGR